MAQAAFYTLGTFGELRDAVIATMDTGSRQWDYEVIPEEQVGQALERASERLGQLGAHLVLNGPDPDVLPDRDFSATSWHCRSCPFLAVCLPGTAAEAGGEGDVAEDAEPAAPVTDEEAWNALHEYEEIQDTIREFEDEKRWVVEKLRAWLGQQSVVKAKLEGRENTRSVGMVSPAAIRWTTGGSTTCWTRTYGPRSSPRASPSTCVVAAGGQDALNNVVAATLLARC